MIDLVLRQLGEAVHKRTNRLHVFIFPNLMVLVWGRLIFKIADLVVYGPPGGRGGGILNAKVVRSWFYFPPIITQALVVQGDNQGSVAVKDGVFPDTGESKRCR